MAESNTSKKTSKAYEGRIGIYCGFYKAEIKTTRCFVELKQTVGNIPKGTRIRCVALWLLQEVDEDWLKQHLSYGRGFRTQEDAINGLWSKYIYIDALDFRENFVYSDTIDMIYGKN